MIRAGLAGSFPFNVAQVTFPKPGTTGAAPPAFPTAMNSPIANNALIVLGTHALLADWTLVGILGVAGLTHVTILTDEAFVVRTAPTIGALSMHARDRRDRTHPAEFCIVVRGSKGWRRWRSAS